MPFTRGPTERRRRPRRCSIGCNRSILASQAGRRLRKLLTRIERGEQMSDQFLTEEIVFGGHSCKHCKASHGIHIVTCPDFSCHECGKSGPDEDHRGGCPTRRRDEVRWVCQCGAFGWMSPTNRSLAGLVRQARREHRGCKDPDIEKLETRDEYERRLYQARFHAGVF